MGKNTKKRAISKQRAVPYKVSRVSDGVDDLFLPDASSPSSSAVAVMVTEEGEKSITRGAILHRHKQELGKMRQQLKQLKRQRFVFYLFIFCVIFTQFG